MIQTHVGARVKLNKDNIPNPGIALEKDIHVPFGHTRGKTKTYVPF